MEPFTSGFNSYNILADIIFFLAAIISKWCYELITIKYEPYIQYTWIIWVHVQNLSLVKHKDRLLSSRNEYHHPKLKMADIFKWLSWQNWNYHSNFGITYIKPKTHYRSDSIMSSTAIVINWKISSFVWRLPFWTSLMDQSYQKVYIYIRTTFNLMCWNFVFSMKAFDHNYLEMK